MEDEMRSSIRSKRKIRPKQGTPEYSARVKAIEAWVVIAVVVFLVALFVILL